MVSQTARKVCQICDKGGRLLRCQQCQASWYCSVACQRIDWKAGHRRRCIQSKTRQASDAWVELSNLLATAPIDHIDKDFHVASEKVRELTDNSRTPEVPATSVNPNISALDLSSLPKPRRTQPASEVEPQQNSRKIQRRSLEWRFCIEEMPQLSCYSVLMRRVEDLDLPTTLKLDKFQIQLLQKRNHTQVSLVYSELQPSRQWKLLEISLPKPISNPRLYLVENDSAVSLRLPYSEDSMSDPAWRSTTLLTPGECARLACCYCHQRVLTQASNRVKRVLSLPSGHWEEMQDYLTCFPGQATFDFSSISTSGQEGILLEGESVLVAHSKDVGVNSCVMASIGYGEDPKNDFHEETNAVPGMGDKRATALYRGSRPWRDAVGGATLTCSLCASTLGFAPIELNETCRFMKHRLAVLKEDKQGCSSDRLQSVSSFIANEMVRFAETNAVFTFAVNVDSSEHYRLLLLRLVSWDTTLATSEQQPQDDNGYLDIKIWHPMAKIIYEDTYDEESFSDKSGWMWTNGDFCCPPMAGVRQEKEQSDATRNEREVSMVRLCLPLIEWENLRTELQKASQLFSLDIVNATIQAKMGNAATSRTGTGLAAVRL